MDPGCDELSQIGRIGSNLQRPAGLEGFASSGVDLAEVSGAVREMRTSVELGRNELPAL